MVRPPGSLGGLVGEGERHRLDWFPERSGNAAQRRICWRDCLALRRSSSPAGVVRAFSESARQRTVRVRTGVIHAALGDEDQAFKWLALAVQERSGWIAYLRVDPRLDKLHTDARFTELTPTRAAGS